MEAVAESVVAVNVAVACAVATLASAAARRAVAVQKAVAQSRWRGAELREAARAGQRFWAT